MSDAPVFRLNPAINARDYAETFRRDGIVQINNIFEPSLADHLATVLKEMTFWRVAYTDDKKSYITLSRRLETVEAEQLLGDILRRASTGFSYVYLACPIDRVYVRPGQADHPLYKLFQFLNSPAFLAFGREVIGEDSVAAVDANATWYRPGDFLTLHTDGGAGRRRAAYTLGFTQGWRPDWGGQLLFHDETGEIVRGLIPGFNVLTLFKTPRSHSVAQVASYATSPRLTVSGWLLRGDDDG